MLIELVKRMKMDMQARIFGQVPGCWHQSLRIFKWYPMPGSAQSTLWQAFRTVRIPQSIINWLVVWNMNGLWLSIQLGMSSSQLTLTPWFFRGVGQPLTRLLLTIINHILTIINHILIVYYRGLGRSTTNQMKNESSRCCSETNRPRTWDFHSFGRHTLCQGSDKSLEPWFCYFGPGV